MARDSQLKSWQNTCLTDSCEEVRNSLLGVKQRFDLRKPADRSIIEKTISSAQIRIRKQTKVSSWTIKRSNKYRCLFAVSVNVLTFYSVFTSLFYLSFRRPAEASLAIDYCVQGTFALDFVLQAFVERRGEKGKTGREGSVIGRLKMYARWWLWWDALAVMPFREMGMESLGYIFRLSRIWKMHAVLERLQSIWLERYTKGRNRVMPKNTFKVKFVLSLGSLLFWMFFILYVAAAGIGYYRRTVVDLGYREAYWKDDGSASGLLKEMYLLLSTLSTIGFGDLSFSSFYDWLFLIFTLFPGVTLYSYIIARLSSMLRQYRDFTGESDPLPGILAWVSDIEYRFGQLDCMLSQRIIRHFQYYAQADRLGSMAKSYWKLEWGSEAEGQQDEDYTAKLPLQLQRDVLEYVFKDVFYNFRSFFGEGLFKFEICTHFQPREFLPGETILEEHETAREVTLVTSGKVGCGLILGSSLHSLVVFEKGRTVIGDYSALTSTHSIATFQACGESPVQALAIPKRPFQSVLCQGHGDLRGLMLSRAAARNSHVNRLVHEYSANLNSKLRSAHGLIVMLLIRIFNADQKTKGVAKALRKLLFTANQTKESVEIDTVILKPSLRESFYRDWQQVLLKEQDWVIPIQHSGVLSDIHEIATVAESFSESLELKSIAQLDLRSEVSSQLHAVARRLTAVRRNRQNSDHC